MRAAFAAGAVLGLGFAMQPSERLWTETNRNKGKPHFTSERPMTKRQKRRARRKAKP
jgi:hypothetical protein